MIGEVFGATNPAVLHKSAGEVFVSAAVDALKVRCTFRVALADGATPEAVYGLVTIA
jgi:hypothetical protein